MVKYILITVFGLCALGGVGVGLYILLSADMTSQKKPSPTNVAQSPSPSSAQNLSTPLETPSPIMVSTKDGGELGVHDFRNQTESRYQIFGTQGDGYVMNNETQSPGYSIAYIISAQTFSITLTKAPFTETQKDAEQELLRRLRISEGDMCKLRVSISGIVNGKTVDQGSELMLCKKI